MIICHYKKTPIAWSPDAISDCINKYTEHESYLNEKFEHGDIINYHNKYINASDAKKLNINFHNIIKLWGINIRLSLLNHHSYRTPGEIATGAPQ